MKIILNESEVESITILKDKIKDTNKNLDIEIIYDENNWIQFFKENGYISVVKNQNGKRYYCREINVENIYEYIDDYVRSPDTFRLDWNIQNRKMKERRQPLQLTCTFLRNMFLILLLLTIIQMIFILMSGEYQGSVFMKIYKYYSDLSIHPKQKSLPIFTVTIFIVYIACLIKQKIKKKMSLPYILI